MKAVFCEKLEGPDALVVHEVAEPGPPGGQEIKVAIEARGVSFTDVLMSKGEYQVQPTLPFIIGGEGAGRVIEIGDNVNSFSVGDAVLVSAGCVEQVVVEARRATVIPKGTDLELAASFRSNYATAFYAMQRGRLTPGETLLVHGAAGGVGLAGITDRLCPASAVREEEVLPVVVGPRRLPVVAMARSVDGFIEHANARDSCHCLFS